MTLRDELESAEAAANAIHAIRIKREGRNAEVTLSNGIVLGCKPVPPLMANAIGDQFQPPEPPEVMNETKGRMEPNEADPDYGKALAAWDRKRTRALSDFLLATGTWVISVPRGMHRPDEDGWIANVELASKLIGEPLDFDRDDEHFRYIAWLRLYAMETLGDVTIVSAIPNELSNLNEGEVVAAMESFRGVPQRPADNGAPSEPERQNGNNLSRSQRRARPPNRGT